MSSCSVSAHPVSVSWTLTECTFTPLCPLTGTVLLSIPCTITWKKIARFSAEGENGRLTQRSFSLHMNLTSSDLSSDQIMYEWSNVSKKALTLPFSSPKSMTIPALSSVPDLRTSSTLNECPWIFCLHLTLLQFLTICAASNLNNFLILIFQFPLHFGTACKDTHLFANSDACPFHFGLSGNRFAGY